MGKILGFGWNKDAGKAYPKLPKKNFVASGVKSSVKPEGITQHNFLKRPDFHEITKEMKFNLGTDRPTTVNVANELIRLDNQIFDMMGEERYNEINKNPKALEEYEWYVYNADVPKGMFTHGVQSYLQDHNNHHLTDALSNIHGIHRHVYDDDWEKPQFRYV